MKDARRHLTWKKMGAGWGFKIPSQNSIYYIYFNSFFKFFYGKKCYYLSVIFRPLRPLHMAVLLTDPLLIGAGSAPCERGLRLLYTGSLGTCNIQFWLCSTPGRPRCCMPPPHRPQWLYSYILRYLRTHLYSVRTYSLYTDFLHS